MNTITTLSRGLTAWILSVSLFLLAVCIGVITTVASPTYIKQTLDGAGFYDNIVNASLNLAASNVSNSNNNEQINQATITEMTPVIQSVLTPTFLQTTIETIIDSGHAWLVGDTATPLFAIKTADLKVQLTSALSGYLKNRVTSLPICPPGTATGDFDPFTATCRPNIAITNSSFDATAADFVNQLPLLDKGEISIANFDTDNKFNDSSVNKVAPNAYQKAMFVPYVVISLIVACTIFILLLSRPRFKAIKTIGTTFLFASVLLLISGAVIMILSGRFDLSTFASSSPEQKVFMVSILNPIASKLGNSFAMISLYVGVAYAIVGALCYVVAHKMRLRHQETAELKK